MSEFKVRIPELRSALDAAAELEGILRQVSGDVQAVRRDLRMEIRQRERINSRLKQSSDQLGEEGQSVVRTVRAGRQAAELYERTELELLGESTKHASANEGASNTSDGGIAGWWQSFTGWVKERLNLVEPPSTEIDSIVFDDDGKYGGDQGSPKWRMWSEKKELYNIVREYYPNYTDKEISRLLKKLNSEGCGYVALINTILASYEGRADEFEETFGFPMYGTDGDLNYDRLLVDFYAATDNHNLDASGTDSVDNREDFDSDVDGSGSSYNYRMDKTGKGTDPIEREYRTHLYLDDKGVSVTVTNNYEVTPETFSDVSKDGYIIISYHDGNLQKGNGDTAQYIDGGHAMVVTGVTDDGRYVVSSWGEKYYIDPNQGFDPNKFQFTGETTSDGRRAASDGSQTIYVDKDGNFTDQNGKSIAWFSFSYYRYD